MPLGNVRPHVARNKVVQALRIGRPRPRAKVEPVIWVGVGEGKPSTAAKTQIVATSFHPLAYGLAPCRSEGGCLEPRVAAGNQQQRYA